MPEKVVMELEIDAQRVACVGEMAQQCLRVRSPGETAWRLFYDPIAGFTHEPGFRYLVKVARSTRTHVPADASLYQYQLLEVLRKEPQ